MKLVKAAVAAVMILPASGAMAQQADSLQMVVGLSMLESNAQNAFREYDINANVRDLSLSQLAQIIGIINDPNSDSGGSSAKNRIQAIVSR